MGCGGDGRALRRRRRRDGHPVPSAAPGRFPLGRGLLCKKGHLCSRSAALSFLIVRSNFFSIVVVFFRSFPPFCRALSRIRQTGLSTHFFCALHASKRPNPAETLETAIRGGRKNDSGRKCFHTRSGRRPCRQTPPSTSLRSATSPSEEDSSAKVGRSKNRPRRSLPRGPLATAPLSQRNPLQRGRPGGRRGPGALRALAKAHIRNTIGDVKK